MKELPYQLVGWSMGIVGSTKGEFIGIEPTFRTTSGGAHYEPPWGFVLTEEIARDLVKALNEQLVALARSSSSSAH